MLTHSPPVKDAAVEAGLSVRQPARASDPGLMEAIAEARPDVAIVVAYGKLIPPALLEEPRMGFVNLHFSLLPLYRGAAPVQRAIMDGASQTGVSVMVLTERMDEGPILAQRAEEVLEHDSAGSLGDRLARLGATLLVQSVAAYAAGELQPVGQDHDRATYAPKVTSEEAHIDWSRPATRISAFARGLDPVPGAWTMMQGRRLKVFALGASRPGIELAVGEVAADGGLWAGTGDGTVALTDVQLQGKRRMAGDELARGLRLTPGTHFE